MDAPRPARNGSEDDLLELVQRVRRELAARDESPTGAWVDQTVRDLRSGAKAGWFYPSSTGGGLAFRSDRGPEAFAHVHVEPAAGAVERAVHLTDTLQHELPESVRSLSVGFTGLSRDEETTLADRLGRRPGSNLIPRLEMERTLGREDEPALPAAPDGLALVPVRDVTIDALADLDWRSFRGTADELLIGTDPAEYRRILLALLAGDMGRFLDEASVALYRSEPPALVGSLLTCERSVRRAVFLDFMITPELRRRGYGRYLLRWGLRALRALGYERVGLWVSASNEAARRLYDRSGFAATRTALIYRWDRAAAESQPHSAA